MNASWFIAALFVVSCESKGDNNRTRTKHQEITLMDTAKMRPEIEKIVSEIAAYNSVDDQAVGYAGVQTAQWKRFDTLTKIAEEDELLSLAEHTSATVRAYAFWALAKRNYTHTKDLFDEHLSDTASIEYFSGCELGREHLNHFYFQLLTPYEGKTSYSLSKEDIAVYRKKLGINY